MIAEDIQLAELLYRIIDEHPELEAFTQNLSISTFRYVPSNLIGDRKEAEEYLNKLNEELLTKLQNSGEAFISNAVVGEKYLLRSCIVNFRTSLEDVRALPDIVTRLGHEVDAALRPDHLKTEE
jgi:glutamate/tyrosine decarboxylase-like PLP-dependent enzyme